MQHIEESKFSVEELQSLKQFRYNRLFKSKPNLKNKIFLDLRRDDWNNYLSNDVKTQEEMVEGLSLWMNEDREGAMLFNASNKNNMTG
jgi:hypothetical protein